MADSSFRVAIFHFHIFKNAGTTIEHILKTNFGPGFMTFDGPDPEGCLPAAYVLDQIRANPEVTAFSSHQAKPPLPRIDSMMIIPIVFIRHPIDRIASIYWFERRREFDHITNQKARELDFARYVQWVLDAAPTANFTNFQTLFCSAIDDYTDASVGLPEYEQALAALAAMPVVGLVDRFDASMALYRHTLKRHFPKIRLDGQAQNVSKNRRANLTDRLADIRRELGPRLYARLCEKNSYDLLLHEICGKWLAKKSGMTCN